MPPPMTMPSSASISTAAAPTRTSGAFGMGGSAREGDRAGKATMRARKEKRMGHQDGLPGEAEPDAPSEGDADTVKDVSASQRRARLRERRERPEWQRPIARVSYARRSRNRARHYPVADITTGSASPTLGASGSASPAHRAAEHS